ncbi:MAG: Gfo/Idh/MocA family oxidoreductase [Planctomycetaceae bacterium]
MPANDRLVSNPPASRRDFLKTSAAAALAAGTLSSAAKLSHGFFTGADETIKVGFIGCGGRGTGAAKQALTADDNIKLWAMGDAFEDRLESSLQTLQNDGSVGSKVDVPKERRFVGFDAYQKVIDSGVDVVLLTTPPQFRPIHIQAAVDAGVHIFAEKPVAVDAPGVRKVLAACEEAKKKKLSVVSGLCLRYHQGFQELVQRVHDGAIGQIRLLQANDWRTGRWFKPRQPDWTDMYYQVRNWYNYTWVGGDFNVEQHVHYLDVCAWLMGNKYPTVAYGLGGRQVQTGAGSGNIYDHFAVVHEYDDGARLISNCRQIPGCFNNISSHFLGTKGEAHLDEGGRGQWCESGGERWQFSGRAKNMYQVEHDLLMASIRKGEPINNGEYQAKSTLLAIMGREACYTGQRITWDQMMNSKQDLSPPAYDWNVELPEPPVAMPGRTKFA